eukprot:CAMPEP_0201510198 /NCGR_PEP_ID=MMETSP0161_2-20130828/2993_1 /ASSEMBLY_ACC=CAM_ASM_000251 /TAXON_ID=180227 /ORGANISM="Neoparamoeba aestuarina, Strain SoJaBio B1-5/56/2" /LENGTH=128 /DNA_ID=CAMNT_0047905341 /DNA_START=75 /DNA_END=461 /DNA_ORIENTATION=+
MARYRRKKNNNKNKIYRGNWEGQQKNVKDIDQILGDMENPEKANLREGDDELPGGGRYYCVPCSRYFIDQKNLDDHIKTKIHRRRMKTFEKGEVYTGPTERIDNGAPIERDEEGNIILPKKEGKKEKA